MKTVPSLGNLKRYLIGYVLSLVLTYLAYYLVVHHVLAYWPLFVTVGMIGFVIAFMQLFIFLHLAEDTRPQWNLLMFIFMGAILFTVVIGTLWIMYHLNYNLMEM